jgi:hypothetical protein
MKSIEHRTEKTKQLDSFNENEHKQAKAYRTPVARKGSAVMPLR